MSFFVSVYFVNISNLIGEYVLLKKNFEIADGIITGVSDSTSTSSRSYYFSFITNNQTHFSNTSYGYRSNLHNQDSVQVFYHPEYPKFSRIAGLSLNKRSPWWAMLYLIPLLIGGVLIRFYRLWRQQVAMLRKGILSDGVITAIEKPEETNGIAVLHFEFIDKEGEWYKGRVAISDVTKFTIGAREPVIYDPQDLSKLVIINKLPKVLSRYIIDNWKR